MDIVPQEEALHPVRVFVCYAHENAEHKAAVHDLDDFLHSQGIDVVLDRWAEGERQDWDLWMRQKIPASDFVLVIASKTVRLVADGPVVADGRGLRPELDLLRDLHREGDWWRRILPVILPGGSIDDIPSFLSPRNRDHYPVASFTVAGATSLLRVLTGQRVRPRPAPGPPVMLPPELAGHWTVSARGTDRSPEEFWFTGRRLALSQIDEFVRPRRAGLLVVTGMPGAGKSALLGVCVLRSLAPSLLPDEVRGAVPDFSIEIAVHAQGKPADAVLAEVARTLGGSPDTAVDIRDLLDALLRERDVPVCLIDAVDEAEDPATVADAVRWLSQRAVTIVGVRSDAPTADRGDVGLPSALAVRHPVVIDLDAPDHASARDVAAYVARRLRADTGRPDGYGTAAWDMNALVDVIGMEIQDEVAAGNFLIAQLVVEEMYEIPVVADRRRGWSDELHWPRQLQDWIGRDLRRRCGQSDASRARSTLAPVAHALRGGLKLDLWRVLIPMFGDSGNPDEAIAWVLATLGFYLTSPARGRYALRHQQFAGYFAAVLPEGRGNQIFVGVLRDAVPRRADGQLDWADIDDYTALNLLAHAHGAGALESLIGEHPACLAAVDRLSAARLLSAVAEPSCLAAADVLRRAAYETSADYGHRSAALQAHAALAGHDDLAVALLSQAGTSMPWTVPWWAGVPDGSPVAVGAAERSQAVVPVAGGPDEPPCLVLVLADGTCSLRDGAGGERLTPDVAVEPFEGDSPPEFRAWRTPGGVVHFAVGRADGRVAVWSMTGGSAGTVIWECSVGAGLRDLARVRGPRGTDLIVTLAAGVLTVQTLRPFQRPDADALLRTSCPAARVLPLEPSGGAAAFLTAGADTDLTAWRLTPETGTEPPRVHPGWRAGTVLAGGDADRACVLANADQVGAVWLTAGLSVAGPPQHLDDGGRTARVALAVQDGHATAAVADGSGGVQVFGLPADAPAKVAGRYDTGRPVYHLAFVDRKAEMLAVGGWSDIVTVLHVRERHTVVALQIQHGESAITVLPLGAADGSALMATRGMTGLTRVWQLPPVAESSESPHPPVTSLNAVPLDGQRVLVTAMSEGQETVRCWSADPVLRRVESWPEIIHPGGVLAAGGARVGGRGWLLTAGGTGSTLWSVTGDGVRVETHFGDGREDVEHVIVGCTRDHGLVLGTAGPEHLRIWTAEGVELVDEEEFVTALSFEQDGDRLLVATGGDDGLVRLIELGGGGTPAIRTVYEGDSMVAVAILVSGKGETVVAADRYNRVVAVPGDIDAVLWQISQLAVLSSAGGRRLFGVATSPPRLLSWVADEGGLRLDRAVLGDLRGEPRLVARTESAVAVADGGGQLVVAADDGTVTAVNLNVAVDALAGLPGTDTFVAARGGRLIGVEARVTGVQTRN